MMVRSMSGVRLVWALGCVAGLATGCQPKAPANEPQPKESATKMNLEEAPFGKTPTGVAVAVYTCTNANGLVIKLINYGAIFTAVEIPDREGKLANVTLSFPSLAGYQDKSPYFGATIGRYGNRIAKGKFTLDGQQYTLATNNGVNHLHGGVVASIRCSGTPHR